MKKKLCLALVCLLLGCSGEKLDRKTAVNKIRAQIDGLNTIVVQVGRVGSHCAFASESGRVVKDLNPETTLQTIVAVKAGYVTVTPDGAEFWRVGLTNKGKDAQDPQWVNAGYHNQLEGCDFRFSGFVVAQPEFTVTGISGDEKTPEVEFEWKWRTTELGAALRENGSVYSQLTPQQRKDLSSIIQNDPSTALQVPVPVPLQGQTEKEVAKFKKYDDGWRLQTR